MNLNKTILKVMAIAILLLWGVGCTGKKLSTRLTWFSHNKDEIIIFPDGALSGTASDEQARKLAEIFVRSHNDTMMELDKVKQLMGSLSGPDSVLEKTLNRIEERSMARLEASQKSAQESLEMIRKLSEQQGAGEITIFYPIGQSSLKENSVEYKRLVRFLDHLATQSHGRKIIYVSIGCASSIGGTYSWNKQLAKKRAVYPKKVIEKYHVNMPHEFYMTYGIVSEEKQTRYQHTRIIAVFQTDQLPDLPQSDGDKQISGITFDPG